MPWSNQSGGGNSGGPQGPWNQRPQGGGGGQQPPDLEDLIRKGQEHLKSLLPGNGPNRFVVLIALALGFVWFASNSFFTVQPDQVGVVTRFGAYQGPPRTSGLNFMLWPIDQVALVRVTRVNQEEIGFRSGVDRTGSRKEMSEESQMLTRDENIVSVGFTVSWAIRPDRPQDFLFNATEVQATVRAVAESAMREVVGRNRAEDIITKGQTILQADVQKILQETLDAYGTGVLIRALSVSRPEVPPAVRDAFNDVQQAAQDAQTFQNQSRRDANKLLADARGDAATQLQEADGYSKRVSAEALGDAARFISIYNEYKNAKDVTQRRIFLETMEKVLSGANKVVMDNAGGQGVLPYLPLPELRRPADAPQGAAR
jgi:membrane protease subunit HflK